jgi:hypothetical protein
MVGWIRFYGAKPPAFITVYINISAKDYERSLREVTLSIVNWDTCNEAIENAPEKSTYKLTGNMICAGGGTDHDACQVCLLFRSQGNSTVLFSYLVRYQLFFNYRAGSGWIMCFIIEFCLQKIQNKNLGWQI